MKLFREYVLIVVGGFIGAALGAAFGGLVGKLFPAFVVMLCQPYPVDNPVEMGAGLGMVAGLPIGAGAMVAGRLIGAARHWVGLRDTESDRMN